MSQYSYLKELLTKLGLTEHRERVTLIPKHPQKTQIELDTYHEVTPKPSSSFLGHTSVIEGPGGGGGGMEGEDGLQFLFWLFIFY